MKKKTAIEKRLAALERRRGRRRTAIIVYGYPARTPAAVGDALRDAALETYRAEHPDYQESGPTIFIGLADGDSLTLSES